MRALAAALMLLLAGTATAAPPARLTLAELRARLQRPGDRYVDIGGVELRYRDEGKGPVLLLLHGSRSTLNAWDGLVARLEDRYRIIRFDQPPTGLSGPLSDAAIKAVGGPEAMVARFLDAVKVDRAIVFGTSSGGTLAYYFAAAYPQRVAALVLSNTPSNPVPGLKVAMTPAMEAANAEVKRTGIEDRAFWSTYMTWLYGDVRRIKPGWVDYYTTTNLRVTEKNPFGLHALTANAATTAARLKAVKAPTLILWGMRDPVLQPREGEALYAYLAGARSRSFVALDTVGHYPPMESPAAVADLVDAWLRRDR